MGQTGCALLSVPDAMTFPCIWNLLIRTDSVPSLHGQQAPRTVLALRLALSTEVVSCMHIYVWLKPFLSAAFLLLDSADPTPTTQLPGSCLRGRGGLGGAELAHEITEAESGLEMPPATRRARGQWEDTCVGSMMLALGWVSGI